MDEATREPDVKRAPRSATNAAHAHCVFGVLTIAIDDELLWETVAWKTHRNAKAARLRERRGPALP